MIVRNLEELTSKGNVRGRRIVLDIIESALEKVNSRDLVKKLVELRNCLRIGSLTYDLGVVKNVFVVGGGKQVTYAAAALEDVLGDRISDGVVVEKKGWGCKTKRIRVVKGGHPLPDSDGVNGAREVLGIAERADRDDLVIVCVTGGCTSLIMLPPRGIPLDDVREVCDLLLRSGAPINDMNVVRKHLSQLGGGKLALHAHPAETVSLIAVDEVAGLPWGPTVPDTTTFSDAIRVLKAYDLWHKTPASVRDYLEKANPLEETPKIDDFAHADLRVNNIVFAENSMLCEAAQRRANELGIDATIVTTSVEGEAREVGTLLANISREIEKNDRPFKAPRILIAGGETTVNIMGKHGEGGRNQELALAAALKITGSDRIVIASIGTDGTDGPTDIAGAIVDGSTLDEANRSGIDLLDHLRTHNSSNAFKAMKNAVYTGDTATNLMDLIIIHVMNR